jgi:hypothetical protein
VNGRDYTSAPAGTLNIDLAVAPIFAALPSRRIGWHSFASHLAMRGKTMRTIQLLMGHSTVQMTERYAHLSPVTLRDAVWSLGEPAPCITAESADEIVS